MLDSVTDLRSLLKDPSLLATKAYVAGEWIDADDGTSFEVTNGPTISQLTSGKKGGITFQYQTAARPSPTAKSYVWRHREAS